MWILYSITGNTVFFDFCSAVSTWSFAKSEHSYDKRSPVPLNSPVENTRDPSYLTIKKKGERGECEAERGKH